MIQQIISTIAKHVHKLNSHVSWAIAALESAKSEGKAPAYLATIKKMITQGQYEHDEVSYTFLPLD